MFFHDPQIFFAESAAEVTEWLGDRIAPSSALFSDGAGRKNKKTDVKKK